MLPSRPMPTSLRWVTAATNLTSWWNIRVLSRITRRAIGALAPSAKSLHDRLCERTRHVDPPVHYFSDGGNQFLADRVLQHVPRASGDYRLDSVNLLQMHRQEDDLRIRIVFADLSRGFESVEQGHANVGDDCVRLQLMGGRNQRASISNHTHDFKLGAV